MVVAKPKVWFCLTMVMHCESYLPKLQNCCPMRTSLSSMKSTAAEDHNDSTRRSLMLSSLAAFIPPDPAQARGLIQFPVQSLFNTYHFLRVGETLLDDIWSTNPLFLTNRDDALSPKGEQQVLDACRAMRDDIPSVVKHSFAASAIDTATLVGREFNIGRSSLVPEFFFLDPRGLGQWDNLLRATTEPAVWYMDETEAGPAGVGGRPPPKEDGTPHETLADQAVRLRQLLSATESQFSGNTICFVFPDGTGPALLSCMIAGIPYNLCHRLDYAPGEVRLDVNFETTRALFQQKKDDPAYQLVLEKGEKELAVLRNKEVLVSVKDQRIEEEQAAIDEELRGLQDERSARLAKKDPPKDVDGGTEVSPVALAGVAALVVGGGAFLNGAASNDAVVGNRTESVNVPVGSSGDAGTPPIPVEFPPIGSRVESPIDLLPEPPRSVQPLASSDMRKPKPSFDVEATEDSWLSSLREIMEDASDAPTYQEDAPVIESPVLPPNDEGVWQ